MPDRDALREQAAVASVSAVCGCSSGCAGIDFTIDQSKARPARILLRPIASAHTEDMAGVDADHPLVAFGPRGEGRFPWRETRGHGSICVMLWGQDGWLSGIEITEAGDFFTPTVFPPAHLFEPPRPGDMPSTGIRRLFWAMREKLGV